MLQLSDFRTRFPELASYTDAQVLLKIQDADAFFDPARWDDLLDLGMAYWVAHELVLGSLNAKQQATDDAVMKKIGELSKQRDGELMNKQADNPYYRTTYGQRYLYYMNYVGAGGVSV
jgi:hypothetical protein